jgi:hypothetical protein
MIGAFVPGLLKDTSQFPEALIGHTFYSALFKALAPYQFDY